MCGVVYVVMMIVIQGENRQKIINIQNGFVGTSSAFKVPVAHAHDHC